MPAESKGRPKAKRKFKWFPKEGDFGKWFEDMNYDPENKDNEPEWVDATFVPSGDKKVKASRYPMVKTGEILQTQTSFFVSGSSAHQLKKPTSRCGGVLQPVSVGNDHESRSIWKKKVSSK